MASSIETNTGNKINILCRFFQNGNCRYGDNCFYSHDQTNNYQEPSVCKYYLLGCCAYGSNCYFQHPTDLNSPSNSLSSSASSSAQTQNISSTSSSSSLVETAEEKTVSNSKLVTRMINKPKLVFKNLTDNDNQNNISNSNEYNSEESNKLTPESFYEAVTGKKLSNHVYEENIDEMNMFDENYAEYLKRRSLINNNNIDLSTSNSVMCPYFEKLLDCPFGENCYYIHGAFCDMCNTACLNPFDLTQQEEHKKECMKLIEKEMEEAFAVQRSSEKCCGICMEVVWEKEKIEDRRFGIMENCNHTFCLPCIRKWRSSKSYENKIVKACPECRVKSDYVTPSRYWFDEKDEESKKQIIKEYKDKLGNTACKYFKQGDGRCPFGSKCFYLHKYRDGSIAHLPDPQKRYRYNRSGLVESFTNIVRVDFDFSDDFDYEDDFDLIEFFTNNLIWDTDTDYDDYEDIFEISDEF